MMFFAKKVSICAAVAGLSFLLGACGGGNSTGTSSSTSSSSGGTATYGESATAREFVISWSPPTQNTDGTTLYDLAGYKIYYGVSADNLSDSITVDANSTSYTLTGLVPGTTYYFAMTTHNSAGAESEMSGVVNTTV